jgi:pimeloyl-ACP methyl ester carboxylesterase
MLRLVQLIASSALLFSPMAYAQPSAAPPPSTKLMAIGGTQLQYAELGAGEPILFVHGAPQDLRAWEPVREMIATKHRFVAYTQRYFGTEPWKDDGKQFSVAMLAEDLTEFIKSLNAGPVHLVAWSYGGQVATIASLKNPSLVRSLILYEPSVNVLAPDSPEGKAAREDRAKILGPAVAANKAGDTTRSARLLHEGVFQLPPGGFDNEPQTLQTIALENARPLTLVFTAPPPPIVTCEMLKSFTRPTLLMHGEKTQTSYKLMAEEMSKCVPGARLLVIPNVNHAGPRQDPTAFSAAVLEFVSSRQ